MSENNNTDISTINQFENRVGENLNRRKLTIISQSPNELIVDVDRLDKNITTEGTKINAETLNSKFQSILNQINTVDTGTKIKIGTEFCRDLTFSSDPQTQITNEISSRTNKDNELENRITNEASARNSTDTTLQLEIDDINIDISGISSDISIIKNDMQGINNNISSINSCLSNLSKIKTNLGTYSSTGDNKTIAVNSLAGYTFFEIIFNGISNRKISTGLNSCANGTYFSTYYPNVGGIRGYKISDTSLMIEDTDGTTSFTLIGIK